MKVIFYLSEYSEHNLPGVMLRTGGGHTSLRPSHFRTALWHTGDAVLAGWSAASKTLIKENMQNMSLNGGFLMLWLLRKHPRLRRNAEKLLARLR